MIEISGAGLLARTLKSLGVEVVFYLMGGPMFDAEREMGLACGIRMIDVRHEQAAAMMAHAYSRVSGKPGVCVTGAGVDAMNLVTGLAAAHADCSPVMAICGSAPLARRGMGVFQEMDQLEVMKPITKGAWRVPSAERIPAFVETALRHALAGKSGPVYVEVPSDVLDSIVGNAGVAAVRPIPKERPMGDKTFVKKAVEILAAAERPIVLVGSGVLWSQASSELRDFVEDMCVPFYTTPQARGVIPEDHPLCFLGARSIAFREADCVLVIGTRANYIVGHFQPPRFAAEARFIQINIDPTEIGHNRPADVGIVGDARAVLRQLTGEAKHMGAGRDISKWIERLRTADAEKKAKMARKVETNRKPIHPRRLCEEIRDVLPRDAILVVDGNETLNFARQIIPSYYPGHRINVGPSGCIGVGVPFGIGAKVAKPDKAVVVFSGDGGFGMNGMEMDTAVRHNIPIVVVVNNNGGWATGMAGVAVAGPELGVIGRDLGFTRYDKVAEALGAYAEFVENPEDIRPALGRALECGKPALVNVVTDPNTMAVTQDFGGFLTSQRLGSSGAD